MPSFLLDTPHGLISITDTALKNNSPTLLLLHGNSSSSQIFHHMLDSPTLTTRYRLITFDLPGHGASSNAPEPEKSYCMRGYAELAVHILQHLNVESVVVFGWSLGGHVGIEMVGLLGSKSLGVEMKGLMITGTPPARGKEQVHRGFKSMGEDLGLAGKKDWSEEETEGFARNSAAAGKEELFESWMLEDARRTDGRARMMMVAKFAGGPDGEEPIGVDQREVVETADVLVAVVNGGKEQFVNLDYLEGIRWKRLWKGKCLRLEGLGHAPFWERPEEFEGVLVEFLGDCEKEG